MTASCPVMSGSGMLWHDTAKTMAMGLVVNQASATDCTKVMGASSPDAYFVRGAAVDLDLQRLLVHSRADGPHVLVQRVHWRVQVRCGRRFQCHRMYRRRGMHDAAGGRRQQLRSEWPEGKDHRRDDGCAADGDDYDLKRVDCTCFVI